jgi:hypothetical protein
MLHMPYLGHIVTTNRSLRYVTTMIPRVLESCDADYTIDQIIIDHWVQRCDKDNWTLLY